ncbi:uncharacterized protein BO80DRAFT_62929 [Aspergillus ibericus CBS 121593]|uniref:Uncharacterized protein n=1 Tax=Aspergillus ibericus CBS 121593 TaxID=1448316 RepID=A0A395H0T9_9EURO|nr:hypothetical protein BO80DRAFT_62929 [Aspergillus ibericus CBS 121593]RAL01213.1 hypothetical protein BO80DRAFT_62929 [Aspergillus ibericus CBS 121593]
MSAGQLSRGGWERPGRPCLTFPRGQARLTVSPGRPPTLQTMQCGVHSTISNTIDPIDSTPAQSPPPPTRPDSVERTDNRFTEPAGTVLTIATMNHRQTTNKGQRRAWQRSHDRCEMGPSAVHLRASGCSSMYAARPITRPAKNRPDASQRLVTRPSHPPPSSPRSHRAYNTAAPVHCTDVVRGGAPDSAAAPAPLRRQPMSRSRRGQAIRRHSLPSVLRPRVISRPSSPAAPMARLRIVQSTAGHRDGHPRAILQANFQPTTVITPASQLPPGHSRQSSGRVQKLPPVKGRGG